MVKVGQLEVRTVQTPEGKAKVVKLPGHEFDIEHFFPQNHYRQRRVARAIFVRSRLGGNPEFVKKLKSTNEPPKLDLLSELKLARYINGLNVAGIRAEEPLAVIMHPKGRRSVMFRKIEGEYQDWDYNGRKATEIENELRKHGIEVYDAQWFKHDNGQVTLVDLEKFRVTGELKRKLGLKYLTK